MFFIRLAKASCLVSCFLFMFAISGCDSDRTTTTSAGGQQFEFKDPPFRDPVIVPTTSANPGT